MNRTRSRTHRRIELLVLVCLVAVGCSGDERPEHASPGVEERAKAALAPLKQQLMGELTRAMAEGGPVNALDVCRVRAQEISEELSREDVRVGRTSHRVRNPANAPAPWMEPLLAAYVTDSTDRTPRTVRVDDNTTGYVEPIVAQELCLKCHGGQLDPDIDRKLSELYPDDAATGFVAGDLRGMFWVTLPREES
jgi:hypothetical protein